MSGEARVLLWATAAFLAANVLLGGVSVGPVSLIEADALTFHRMAMQFLEMGRFAEQERQPMYPLVMALCLRVAGENGPMVMVGLQIAALLATATIAWKIARDWIPDGAAAVYALVLLNPNAMANAHWPLADTLHAMLFTAATYALLRHARGGGFGMTVVCGISLGLAALTRPETAFLVYLLPLALPFVAWTAGRGPMALRSLADGAVAFAIALALLSPWMLHNSVAEGQLAMTGSGKAYANARGHYALVVEGTAGRPSAAVIAELTEREPQLLAENGLAEAPAGDQRAFLVDHYLAAILASPPAVLGRLYFKAWVGQFVSGGAQSLNALLGYDSASTDKLMNRPNSLGLFVDGLQAAPAPAAVITVLCVFFAAMARLLGLAGFLAMAARRHWPLLALTVVVLAFKGLVHFFYGISRYRLSVEPLLMILAVYGWQGLRSSWSKR